MIDEENSSMPVTEAAIEKFNQMWAEIMQARLEAAIAKELEGNKAG